MSTMHGTRSHCGDHMGRSLTMPINNGQVCFLSCKRLAGVWSKVCNMGYYLLGALQDTGNGQKGYFSCTIDISLVPVCAYTN